MNLDRFTNVSISIIAAGPKDVDRLVAYGERFWEQTTYFSDGIEYDVETVTDLTHDLLDNGVVLFAEDPEGDVIGLMLIIVMPFLMNRQVDVACEWVFYVDPMYRYAGLGRALVEEAEEILCERDVKLFTLVSLENIEPETVGKLYESLGFERSETNYTKDLRWRQ